MSEELNVYYDSVEVRASSSYWSSRSIITVRNRIREIGLSVDDSCGVSFHLHGAPRRKQERQTRARERIDWREETRMALCTFYRGIAIWSS